MKKGRGDAPQGGDPPAKERIWQVVSMIPPGKVASYGQVAALAGLPAHARYVGALMARLPPGTALPWHRVVNAGLRVSTRGDPHGEAEQRRRLEAEGVSLIGGQVAAECRWEARSGFP
ncbi:MAG: MGMT family protein [Gammaproteobacteria bacterium]|nr:MGMT family protein [Gammaproteobacteria bacterium]